MARRRKKHHHRRRRVGAVNVKGVVTKVAGVAAGIFASRLLSTKLSTTLSPKITGAISIIAGVMLPKYIKSPIGEGIGDGLLAGGVLAELQAFNVVSGIGYMAPGVAAMVKTGHNNYTPSTARTVGANVRPFVKQAVGNSSLSGIPISTMKALGALYEE